MTNQRKFGVGIVGLGAGAPPHAKSLQDLSDIIDVRGVYARERPNREAFSEKYGFPACESYQALLDDEKLDAIILLTPPNARKELVERAANAGKHIFMEKPVERTSEAAEYLVETCEKAGVKLGITFQFRFREASMATMNMLESGNVGPLASVVVNVPWWRSSDYYNEPGRGTFAQDGGGVLITQAIHSLDLMLSLTGPVREVAAISGTSKLHDIEVEDFVGAGVQFENGALGSIMATTTSYPGGQEYMVLNCAKATMTLKGSVLTVDWHDGRLEVIGAQESTGGGDNRMGFSHVWHRAQIAEFVEAVQAGRDPVSNGRTAMGVHYLIEALLESSKIGAHVTVKKGRP